MLVNRYAKRWTIEPGFRGTIAEGDPPEERTAKLSPDLRFGMGLSSARSHSLFRQGCMLYELIPNMPEHRLAPLMTAFAKAVSHASMFSSLFTQPEMRG